MLRNQYAAEDLFQTIPALSLKMDPVLSQLDTLLEDDTLFQAVRSDLVKRYQRTTTEGRLSTPVEVIVRMLVVKHLYGWSYEKTEQWVSDSLVLRQFCRIYLNPVPDDTVLIRWAKLIQPETLHHLLDHVVTLARRHQVTHGRKLRLDSTVIETNIHHPVDSTLLTDGVRVLSRILTKAKQVVGDTGRTTSAVFRNRVRSATQQMQQIMAAARQRGEHAEQRMRVAYQGLITISEATVQQAQQVQAMLNDQTRRGVQALTNTLHQMLPRVQQVLDQTRRRVLQGEQVPASEKVVSLFEPHTAIIRKGKPGKPTEFGRVIWLDEVDGGIISRYEVLDGNPDESAQLQPSLDHHLKVFKRPPRVLAGDRGVHSSDNERYATKCGVQQVVLPKPGAKTAKRSAHEQQRWFRRGRNWRAGIEGRISGLKRRHGLERCRNHGDGGMERWVGWGIIAHDLRVIAEATAA